MKKPTREQILDALPDLFDAKEIGDGGFKTVFRIDDAQGTRVLKTIWIPTGVDGDPKLFREECIARVEREVQVLRECKSPFIVTIHDDELQLHEIDGETYAVYQEEFIQGVDLWQLICRKGEQPEEDESRLLMRCLLEAITELWRLGYVHRDIKPPNVMRTEDRERPFVLLDLGIAFAINETRLTHNADMRMPIGTLRYMPPEVADPSFRNSLDYRSDLYGAAITVFEYSSKMHPLAHAGDDVFKSLSRTLHETPKRLHDLCPSFSEDFCGLVDQLLKKSPALRPGNLKSLLSRI